METKIHILHLEDDPADAELIRAMMDEADLSYQITLVRTRDEYEHALKKNRWDIILGDFKLPMYDGMSALLQAKELRPDVPFIFVSGTMGEEAAIEALTRGATDYVLKHNLSRLNPAVERALGEARNQRQRRQAERALAESENKMRSIMENIGVGVALISPKMEILEINRRMSQWFPGVDPGQHPICYQTFNKPARQEICSYCPTCKTLEDGLVHEATTQTPQDGAIRNYRIVSSPLFNADGEIIAAIEMVDDVTERLREEQAIQQTNEMLRAIIEAAPVAIIGLDLDGHVHSVWNPAAEKMLGWSAQEVMGRPLPTVPQDKQEEFRGFRNQIRKGMNLDGVEVRRQRRDGTPIDYSIYASPLRDADDRISGNIAVLVDITERKQAQRERVANLKFFESMDKVHQAIHGAVDLEAMMKNLLDVVLSTFDCDRAFLMYPCDPESPTWSCPMERTKAAYPGMQSLGQEMPMDPQVAASLRIILAADGPVVFGPGTPHALPQDVSDAFGIKCYLSMALYPKAGKPWQFGIHQCANARVWTAEEIRLFEAIGRRLVDGLSSLLSHLDLRKNEEFLDNVVEHIPDMIFVKDAQTLEFVRFNRAGEQLLGYTREEMLGKSDYDFFPREEADFFTSKDREVLQAKRLLDIPEETVRNRNGKERILNTKKLPILDETGNPKYLLGISQDITERKKAEASVRQLSLAIEQSPVSIVITDVSGKIEFVNTQFTQVTGYTYAEALGQNPRIIKSGETPAEEYRRLWETISSGSVWQGQFQNRKKNGELFWEQATIAPVRDADDVITHYVAVKEDITERKKLEEQLRQVQKMEAIGQLAGGIAHDFNNILSAIIGYTELSQSLLDPVSLVFEYLAQVMEAGGRAKELINQILMFSRETVQELRSIRVSYPVKEALKLIRASVPAHIEIRPTIVSEASALADPTQIHQIVMNLCTNAAHAMHEKGGLLQLNLTDITIDNADERKKYPDAKPGEYILLTVTDQGQGIDAQYLHRIFDPFFTTKEIGEGTGMGLSVVHGIVKSYGGFIYAHSRLGEGSTFEILIPAQESTPTHAPDLNLPIPTGSESILFVDDETMIVDIVGAMLESLGYRVVAITSANEALEAFKNNTDNFDLVVTDMAMPKMSGLDLAEKMLKIRPGFPIVLCTGFDHNMSEAKIKQHGLSDIIYKPILRRDIATVVRNTLDNR